MSILNNFLSILNHLYLGFLFIYQNNSGMSRSTRHEPQKKEAEQNMQSNKLALQQLNQAKIREDNLIRLLTQCKRNIEINPKQLKEKIKNSFVNQQNCENFTNLFLQLIEKNKNLSVNQLNKTRAESNKQINPLSPASQQVQLLMANWVQLCKTILASDDQSNTQYNKNIFQQCQFYLNKSDQIAAEVMRVRQQLNQQQIQNLARMNKLRSSVKTERNRVFLNQKEMQSSHVAFKKETEVLKAEMLKKTETFKVQSQNLKKQVQENTNIQKTYNQKIIAQTNLQQKYKKQAQKLKSDLSAAQNQLIQSTTANKKLTTQIKEMKEQLADIKISNLKILAQITEYNNSLISNHQSISQQNQQLIERTQIFKSQFFSFHNSLEEKLSDLLGHNYQTKGQMKSLMGQLSNLLKFCLANKEEEHQEYIFKTLTEISCLTNQIQGMTCNFQQAANRSNQLKSNQSLARFLKNIMQKIANLYEKIYNIQELDYKGCRNQVIERLTLLCEPQEIIFPSQSSVKQTDNSTNNSILKYLQEGN